MIVSESGLNFTKKFEPKTLNHNQFKEGNIMAKCKDKRGVGRPTIYSDKQIKDIQDKFDKYITDNEIPIVAEFSYTNNLSREMLYEKPEFSTLLKRCIDKKQANLERKGLDDEVNTSMAIFSLKQLGWSDKTEQKDTTKLDKILDLYGLD